MGEEEIGHIPRPQSFTIVNIVAVGRFPCELPLAVLTLNPPGNTILAQKGRARCRTQITILVGEEGIEPSIR